MSKESWDNGLRIEVSITPEQKNTAPVGDSEEISKSLSNTEFLVSKSLNDDKRELTCVAMVANLKDAHDEVFTVEAVKAASEEFLTNYNITKNLGVDHSGETPDIALIGSWFFEEAGSVDGLQYPEFSWVAKMKVLDDDVWESVKNSERTGISIEGAASGFSLEEGEE